MWEFHSRETIWSRNDPLYGDELPSWWWQVHLNKISFTTRFWEIGICHNDTWLLCLSASSFVLPSIHFLALFKHHRQHYYSPGYWLNTGSSASPSGGLQVRTRGCAWLHPLCPFLGMWFRGLCLLSCSRAFTKITASTLSITLNPPKQKSRPCFSILFVQFFTFVLKLD